MKTFLYFQPEYVSKFKCDGSKCNARCCGGWTITIDDATYKKYSRIKPKDRAKEIISHIKFNDEKKSYVLSLKKNTTSQLHFDNYKKEVIVNLKENFLCPFLTENKLCRLQLEYGDEYLSVTCSTYPRRTHRIGKFFERSLTLTCPVAAELILFNEEPMKFEFVEVPDKIHSNHGKIGMKKFPINEINAELFREIQITMISILQRRQFTLDQRLIVLGLFLDKLQEYYQTEDQDLDMLINLIATYRSEEFLLTEMPPLFQSFTFDEQNFILFMMKFISYTLDILRTDEGRRFIVALEKTLGIKPDANDQVQVSEIIANYKRLADARKDFLSKYSPFLENYLVNELFYSFYPWRFREENITKNFAVFLISYKIFELITFATVHSGLDSKEDLLAMVDWFMTKTDHNTDLYKRFFKLLEGIDDTYLLMVTLL